MRDPMHETSQLERATESTLAKLLARFGVPLLLCVVGYLLQVQLAEIKQTQHTQGEDIAQIKSDVRVVNTRIDAQLVRQVDANTQQLEKLDDRVQAVERRVGIP